MLYVCCLYPRQIVHAGSVMARGGTIIRGESVAQQTVTVQTDLMRAD